MGSTITISGYYCLTRLSTERYVREMYEDDESQDRHEYVANTCKCCVISIYDVTSSESIPT